MSTPHGDTDISTLPIGVFDSGLGGLTVLKALCERFTHENFIYLGDTARIPYGSKSAQTIERYLDQNVNYLRNLDVKAIVVACNSASTAALDQASKYQSLKVRNSSQPLPIYNVIEPGARLAAKVTTTGQIGVIATKATVVKKSYVAQLENINPQFQIYQQACPLLVPLVEEGWDDDPITNLIVYRYLSPFLSVGIDTLIMGCTHYPLLQKVIQKVVGASVELVDSGAATVERLESDFQSGVLKPNHSGAASEIRFLSTDVSESYQLFAERIMRPLTLRPLEWVHIE
jgi:glutamate racemase